MMLVYIPSLLFIVSILQVLNEPNTSLTVSAFELCPSSKRIDCHSTSFTNSCCGLVTVSDCTSATTNFLIRRTSSTRSSVPTGLYARISKQRRKELGINDDEDEYDLDKALDVNTDPLITKIIAGSFIITMIGLLFVGLVVPLTSTTSSILSPTLNNDMVEGLCVPLLNGGRC
jgi:hypothetical protein